MDLVGQKLVLIRSDVVDTHTDGGLPSFTCCRDAPEVIAAKPAMTAELILRGAVESIKTNP